MFTIFLVFLWLLVTGSSVYVFEYLLDVNIHNIFLIPLSVVIGLLLSALITWLLLNIIYLLIPKSKIQTSLFTHRILKQIVSVPLHLSFKRIKVIGIEKLPVDTGFTIYSNHISWKDPIVIAYGLYNYPVGALGKEGAFNLPVVGKYAPKFGCVMIHRDDPRQSAKAILKVIKHVEDGLAMVIFPEGTRNPNPNTLLQFKAGAFKVALRSGKPLVPITLIKHKRKGLFTQISIHVHSPLLFDEFKHLKTNELSAAIKETISSVL